MLVSFKSPTLLQCRLYELNNGKRITVTAASKIFANNMYSYKGRGLSVVRHTYLPACISLIPARPSSLHTSVTDQRGHLSFQCCCSTLSRPCLAH